jgi:hypothetical protein
MFVAKPQAALIAHLQRNPHVKLFSGIWPLSEIKNPLSETERRQKSIARPFVSEKKGRMVLKQSKPHGT